MSLVIGVDEARLTLDRDERKYLLPGATGSELAHYIGLHVAPHRHRDESDPAPEPSVSCATTVYLDTEQRELYRAAVSQRAHVKVRIREYYDAALEPPHLALEPRAGRPRMVWIELKTRDGQRSTKRRVCVPKGELARWFPGAATPRTPVASRSSERECMTVAAELARLCGGLGGPLVPSCVVSYRRLSFQDPHAGLRITLDRDVCAFAPRADLFREDEVLSRHALGAPLLEEGGCVLEVKSLRPPPGWIAELLSRLGAIALPFSKFALASRAVHGPL
jgi:hypothetical protein